MSEQLYHLLEFKGVKESIATSLTWYVVDPQRSNSTSYFLDRRSQFLNQQRFETPEGGLIPISIVEDLAEKFSPRLLMLDQAGLPLPFSKPRG